MVPTRKEIAMQIAAAHELYPKETISELAGRLMLSPIFIINALDEGESMELFVRKKNKKGELTDKIELTSNITWDQLEGSEFGPENVRLQNEIIWAIASANTEQNDIEAGSLMAWCRGIKPLEIEVALKYLHEQNVLASYMMADPKDKKSVYTFYSLGVNVSNKWGQKQFKAKTTK